MAFGNFDRSRSGAPLAEINMVPLIDVMLVLLVIFILAAPLAAHQVALQLPKVSAEPLQAEPERIDFAIDAEGRRLWNGQALSRDEAATRFAEAAQRQPQPLLQLRADEAVAYRLVAETLGDASRAGLARIGFLSQPAP
ncbi:biopolymer transporter ExbD [Piscinibacter sp. Jin2]|uniref:Biopolymer transporter ExbD n=1 Tax=Aquariibacter lacus TaxID=2801332 RepID=A0A9X0XBH7_9BURK|nr:biopolymer transporter ExbD [Piscinibacter lacus]MBL0718690.1 biopolymer transporter ExbD [Piscinibacter lacus]